MRDDDSEFGGLRRDQRRVLRELPAVVREQLRGIALESEFVDLRRAEWILRKVAAALLRDFPADLAQIAASCDTRLRSTPAPDANAAALEDEVVDRIFGNASLWVALLMSAWAEQIAIDDDIAP